MAFGPDHSQRVELIELRRGQKFSVNGTLVRKTFWAARIEVISPPDEFIPQPQKHKVTKSASFGMTYFKEIEGQQVAHSITFV
ncbi:hypothetical protein A3A79_03205 [Candidatus Gottesmanbacteria bacterium RIFCSPLOWO2_01_FULL_43_11b]|uniref:Uncharacterized protein n=1 Tax=Candidatus Gottesmanbacteria bacterium RIFCSPLOWO2_01_FULL_43_11b TaxID=1798392 RepID=A0A1F6AIE5_9BACT|nr:MAG: hypothetical protein A3A79_03205 [Candidatus Gottesmanbacteria bacterium RIFCSPLOWO2_01_FULL_43_11b]